MRSRNRTILAVMAFIPFTACDTDRVAGPQQPPGFTVEQTRVAVASNVFGFELLRELPPTATQPNVLLSPLSVSMALGMTLNGASGATFDAMRATLGFGTMTEAGINAAYRGLLETLHRRDRKVEFSIANSVWYERNFPVQQTFLDAARRSFDAHVAPLDFRDPGAPRAINDWVSNRTGGRIRDLLDRIDPLEKLFLVNAMYFKAPWTSPFEPAATRAGTFRRLDGGSVNVPLMTGDASFPHFADDDVQMVEMPYGDSAFGMVIAAPAGSRSFDAFLGSLTPERWSSWMGRLTSGRILLTVPRFRFEWREELKEALAAMGMEIAFLPYIADFTRIANRDDLHISRVVHKTFIDVHERGTEAAAATAVGVSITSLPPSLRFDRPFLFAIRERSSGTILFLGVVGDPSRG